MSLQVAGAVAGYREHETRAAQLWGAAEELRAAISATLSPFEQSYYRPFIEAARHRIGGAAFAAAWAAGKAMTLEDAVGFAMSEELAPKVTSGRHARITTREREVVLLVSRGRTNHQIAEELCISKRTVDSHLRKIFKKLGFRSRTQVAAWATERQSPASDQN